VARKYSANPGDRYGELTVIREFRVGRYWHAECECSCGGTATARLDNLRSGLITTCGHLRAAVPDAVIIPMITAIIERDGRGVTAVEIAAELGIPRHRAARILGEAGLRPVTTGEPEGAHLAPLESVRWDGLVTAKQLSDWSGASLSAIAGAVRRGELTPRGKYGRQLLFDPAKIARQKGARLTPVDSTHELAVKPPPR
jgi:hypothetical protein